MAKILPLLILYKFSLCGVQYMDIPSWNPSLQWVKISNGFRVPGSQSLCAENQSNSTAWYSQCYYYWLVFDRPVCLWKNTSIGFSNRQSEAIDQYPMCLIDYASTGLKKTWSKSTKHQFLTLIHIESE